MKPFAGRLVCGTGAALLPFIATIAYLCLTEFPQRPAETVGAFHPARGDAHLDGIFCAMTSLVGLFFPGCALLSKREWPILLFLILVVPYLFFASDVVALLTLLWEKRFVSFEDRLF